MKKKRNAGKANLRPIVRDVDKIKELFRPILIPIVREMHRLNANGLSIAKDGAHVQLFLSFPNAACVGRGLPRTDDTLVRDVLLHFIK